jgi:hypothetical protein
MKKTLTSEDQQLLEQLRGRVLLTLDFIERREEFPDVDVLRQLIADAVGRNDLRTMRLIARDIDKATIGLTPDERDGLEALLRDRLGVDPDAERSQTRREVEAAIVRGTVGSEKERRRLEDYAEMLEATGGDPAEIEAVRRLVNQG